MVLGEAGASVSVYAAAGPDMAATAQRGGETDGADQFSAQSGSAVFPTIACRHRSGPRARSCWRGVHFNVAFGRD